MRKWRALWLAIPLLGLVELGAHEVFARRAPTPEQWRDARSTLEGLRQSQELVVVAPPWAEPLARFAFGDASFPLDQMARPDVTAFERAIEVSILGQRSEELSGWRVIDQRRSGKLSFRVLENPAPARVAFDFVGDLRAEQVQVSSLGQYGPSPCPWQPRATAVAGGLHGHGAFPKARFECPGGEYFFVGVTVVEDEHYRPRRCLWAHPGPAGTTLIRYRDVPLGSVIRGYAALPWFLMRDGRGTPAELEVRVAGEAIGTLVHDDTHGWRSFEFPLGPYAKRRADVEFEVRSEDPRERHFCFHADTR